MRARLAALAAGDWAGAYASDPRAEPGAPGAAGDDDAVPASVIVPQPDVVLAMRPSLRRVALAVALTAVVTWVVAHLTAGGSPQPIELAPGTPIPSASGVLPVAGGTPSGAAAAEGSPNASSAATSASPGPGVATLVVQVLGEVRRPGLVRLSTGARVADAVAQAGGVRPGGGTGGLNLARLVVDGEQIVVSSQVPVASAGSGPGDGGPTAATDVVDLNSATLADLDSLPGVGPVMAARILDWRTAHARFASVDQLREVSGIGAKTLERLKPHVRV